MYRSWRTLVLLVIDYFVISLDDIVSVSSLVSEILDKEDPIEGAYTLDVFDFFPGCVRFWDADEEFPASLQFLWDANALDFLYYETLWYVMGEVLDRL